VTAQPGKGHGLQVRGSRSLLSMVLCVLGADLAFGQCTLKANEDISNMGGAFCSVNNLHIFTLGSESKDLQSESSVTLDTDTSIYALPWASIHWKGYAKAYVDTYKNRDADTDVVRVTDQAFLHLGHALSDPLQLSFGRLPLPFGLHHETLRYQLPHRNESFWDRSVNGAVFTWRARAGLMLDIGGTNKNESDLADREFSAYTIRAIQHLDLLNGSKLIGSYQNKGGKSAGKMGLATLVFYNEDISSLEWVRIADDYRIQTYQQLFRFVYQITDNDKHWTFEYEDLRRDSYRLALSFTKEVAQSLTFGSAAQYERMRVERTSNWVLLVNLTYNLTLQTSVLRWSDKDRSANESLNYD
jgi:hypothetical protein